MNFQEVFEYFAVSGQPLRPAVLSKFDNIKIREVTVSAASVFMKKCSSGVAEPP